MKAILMTLILCAATTQHADANPPEQFPNQAALVSFWWNQPWIIRTQIFLDGRMAVQTPGTLSGFHMEQYFRCSTTNDIRKTCGHHDDGSATLAHLVSLLPGTAIHDDVQGWVQADGFTQVSIVTCTGDESLAGPVRFKWVALIDLGFGPRPPESAIRPCP